MEASLRSFNQALTLIHAGKLWLTPNSNPERQFPCPLPYHSWADALVRSQERQTICNFSYTKKKQTPLDVTCCTHVKTPSKRLIHDNMKLVRVVYLENRLRPSHIVCSEAVQSILPRDLPRQKNSYNNR